ncbi:polysaccharide lyase family 7 protein [bacterium]|nr:MAG: polysaccharide lyase family 7 protein [bacterium]
MKLRKTAPKRFALLISAIVVVVILCVIGGYMAFSQSAARKEDKVVSKSTSSETKNKDDSDNMVQTVLPDKPAVPGSLLNLANWKIALPVDTARAGTPDEIEQPELAHFTDPNSFFLNTERDGVVFRARADGVTTKNSKYPRSELREMTNTGAKDASWSTSKGTHEMTVRQAITHLPDVKSELVAAQIHDDSDDVIMVRLEKNHLFVEGGGENLGTLDNNYTLGTIYEVKIEVQNNTIKVYYNGTLKVDIKKTGTGYYFKAGCYTQTNTTKGDPATSYGEVIIYNVTVRHS